MMLPRPQVQAPPVMRPPGQMPPGQPGVFRAGLLRSLHNLHGADVRQKSIVRKSLPEFCHTCGLTVTLTLSQAYNDQYTRYWA